MAIMNYKIISISEPAPETKIFRMVPQEGAMLKFAPGQFVFLHILENNKSIAKRPYSIASSPDAPHMEFCIKIRHGVCTGKLDKMKAGEVVGVEGPFGAFKYEDQKEAGFVAGGVGVAPFIGMLRYIADKKLRGRFILFYSTRTKNDVLYADELTELSTRNPDIKVVITLTRETPPGWKGECGRLGDEMIKKHAGDPQRMSWWICGPLEMVAAVKTCLVNSGKDQKDIKMEGWG